MADNTFYGSTGLIGGSTGDLDAISGTDLATGDAAFVVTSAGIYVYYMNASSAAAESSPDIISPDTDAGNKRWILIDIIGEDAVMELLKLYDTDKSHQLSIKWNENDSAGRILNLLVAGGDRSLTLNENLTIGDGEAGTITFSASGKTVTIAGNATLNDWFDQAVKAASSPGFAGLTISGLTASKLVTANASKALESVEPTIFESGGAQEIDGDKLDIDFTPSNYAPDTTPAEASNVDHMAAHLAGIDNIICGFYGVSWNETTDTYTFRGNRADLPIQSAMKRCVLSDAGVVQYYLDSEDSTKKADGSASDLTGGAGQVMVEIPAFYYRYGYNGKTHSWDISPYALPGFSLHPAFTKNGSNVSYRYIGAYEGSMYDASAAGMVSDANAVAEIYASGDKLCSITGQCPKTNETRAEFRAMAAARGAGWRQLDFTLLSAVQLLYLVEYGDFDSQTMIGQGRTELTGGTWVADSYIGKTGKSNADGNGTANLEGDTNDAYMTYRGIENFFGNIWKSIDGININDNIPYITNNDSDWADDTTTNYTRIEDFNGTGITLAASNDFQKTLEQTPEGFLPATVGGSDATYICDYYYQDAGWRVVKFGGTATNGSDAGAFYVSAYSTSSHLNVTIGGRLCF